jgi:hypothetical protein
MKNNFEIKVLSICCYILAIKKLFSAITVPALTSIGILNPYLFTYTIQQLFVEVTVSLLLFYFAKKISDKKLNKDLIIKYIFLLVLLILLLSIRDLINQKLPITILLFIYSLWVYLINIE